jgi:phosphohistidine phosphatase
MDLILWRHGDEANHEDDMRSPLSVRGERQARNVARWLKRHGPKHLRILVSPALRARQTAETLSMPFEVAASLGPQARAADLLALAGWPDGGGKRNGAVVLLAHQPALGQLAALLLSGSEAPWTIKKGTLWWFTKRVRAGETQTILRAVIGAETIDPD